MAEDQTKLRKRLEALLKQPENQYCVDCKKKGKWILVSYLTWFTSWLYLQDRAGLQPPWECSCVSTAVVSTATLACTSASSGP